MARELPIFEPNPAHAHAPASAISIAMGGGAFTPAADGKTLIMGPITIEWRDTQETYWVFGRLTKRPDDGHARAN